MKMSVNENGNVDLIEDESMGLQKTNNNAVKNKPVVEKIVVIEDKCKRGGCSSSNPFPTGSGDDDQQQPPVGPTVEQTINAPSFLTKAFDMVEDPKTNHLISWSLDGESFIIWDHNLFASELLPKHFKHNNLSSFIYQLNNYGTMESTSVIVELVLWSCRPNDAASVACVSRACREIVSNAHLLWKRFLKEELGLTLPVDPNGNICTYAVAYRVWRQSFRAYPWPLVRRAKRCWDRIRKWLQSNFPEALGTLRPGASEEEIELVEARLAVRLPEATRLLYRLCDGQEVGGGSSLGLIGGYTYYDRKVNVYVLPLNGVEVETKRGAEGRVVVAKSSLSTAKMFFLDCEDRQLSVGTADGRALPCVPVSDLEDDPAADGLLLWLEQHVRRLEDGAIKLDVREPRSISQFPPEDALDCIMTVKRGVQVRASVVFAPESTLVEWEWYEFAYRIWLSLGPEGGVLKDGTSFQSCQLVTRQWRISGSDGLVERDDPQPGVRGQFPFLQAGGEEFVYESCVTLPYEAGSLHGAYTFAIAGRDKDLRVRLNPVPLMSKEYIF